MSAALNRSLLEKKDLLRRVFDRFDLNGDGYITHSELEVVGGVNEDEGMPVGDVEGCVCG